MLLTQFLVYEWSLWRGKKFETRVHILFTIIWAYVSTVLLATAWEQYLHR